MFEGLRSRYALLTGAFAAAPVTDAARWAPLLLFARGINIA